MVLIISRGIIVGYDFRSKLSRAAKSAAIVRLRLVVVFVAAVEASGIKKEDENENEDDYDKGRENEAIQYNNFGASRYQTSLTSIGSLSRFFTALIRSLFDKLNVQNPTSTNFDLRPDAFKAARS